MSLSLNSNRRSRMFYLNKTKWIYRTIWHKIMEEMKVYVNNTPKTLKENTMLFDAIKSIGLAEKKGIAVAVNNEVIRKSIWHKHQMQEEDKITIITAAQGG